MTKIQPQVQQNGRCGDVTDCQAVEYSTGKGRMLLPPVLTGVIVIALLAMLAMSGLILIRIRRMNKILAPWADILNQLARNQDRMEPMFRQEMVRNREEMNSVNRQAREELNGTLQLFESGLLARMTQIASLQKNQLDTFSQQLANLTLSNEQKLEQMRTTLEQRVKEMQYDNSQKLEQMRAVVDEKLHATLEQRLGESFKLVSERLEAVHQGLGEMQNLAAGVGDLRKVLGNVKARGTWGEVQLSSILEDILAPDQYAANVAVKKGKERVEFAIRLPSAGPDGEGLWLPIDAKFPLEDYYRLLDAYEQGDAAMAEQAGKQMENCLKLQARTICSKYIDPPATTDFALMFLPTEGLYAEVLRRPGLVEALRRDFRITVAGPTTLAAIVSSFSAGFKTLAIQKRSSEVWAILGAVKTEFSRFGGILEKTQKKLQEASNTIDEATRRSRAMERRLRSVESLPEDQVKPILGDEYSQ